jgi:hypothetical protein
MFVGRLIGERREQGEALAKCLRVGLRKSRSLRLTAILLTVRWPETHAASTSRCTQVLTSGDFFASIGAFIENPFVS